MESNMVSNATREILKEFNEAAQVFRELSLDKKTIKVITHNDADGIAAGAVIHKALFREGLPVHTRSLKQLESNSVRDIANENPEIIIFSDLGSGKLEEIKKHLPEVTKVFVLDHHQPQKAGCNGLIHVNPHNHGIDGAREVSGSGMAYLFARALNQNNKDLAGLALVGAIGDIQDSSGKLIGINREILKDAMDVGMIRADQDLRLYGRQTRPLYKALEYTTEPFIPGLSGSENACINFLDNLGIPIKENNELIMLADLDNDKRKRLTNALIMSMIENKVPSKFAENIVGEVYTLLNEERRTPLRDTKEFATLLNGCGRNEQYSIGMAIVLGERSKLYFQSLNLLKDHKSYIAKCYAWIKENREKIKDDEVLYYFHAKEDINDNVIGTVASMVLNSRVLNPIKPIIAFSLTTEGDVKISSRGTKELIDMGLNLGKAMQFASEKVGGEGGGHNIAAGAKIGEGNEEGFLKYAKIEIRRQLSV